MLASRTQAEPSGPTATALNPVPVSFPQAADHVLLPYAGSLLDADARLSRLIDHETLEGILDLVPDDWLSVPRERFVAYLSKRLEAPRPFLDTAESTRLEVQATGPRSAGRDRAAARADA